MSIVIITESENHYWVKILPSSPISRAVRKPSIDAKENPLSFDEELLNDIFKALMEEQ